ncbi:MULTISPECIES: PhnD/SsuA/transferrin family substrate-binding protein [unclassified Ensifer]|uniref:phosphate/phosphite/phosphonate ABC transporter substrate-binding protein n=1 Tax=unclassified Ensifer TaxID=2633371 RepID=UPI0008138E6C|nr:MULTISPECIES: PhnD/SsuA/transferrin family substrate-binding protein [unclassified Ensifer]OCO99157.1 phosphate ABC transporter substrate-binding protein [Ensifer sp. LC11]OCO99362.1 phosphate ABC transporter substrate-binding protein [Ensifer sp. LC13]OCP12888.1 phosphate ABC transporter substrate-binding protein [Ensifer sp. LC14]OCP29599.1 phosphate ABC transporter substrate-binding protein [Ensifer sp. LC499]
MLLASLAMYVSPPPVQEATRLFWEALGKRIRGYGLEAPKALDETVAYNEAWFRPDLLFGQACGYPYVQHLRGKVQLVATPTYGLPGCDGPLKCSFIIVNAGSSAGSIGDLRGARAAINEPGSNSGYNLFRAAVAPHAIDGRFFSSVVETGGHRASIDAVSSGAADVAAIDCVTFGNTLRFDPERVAGVRILAETTKGPGLPFITAASTSAKDLIILRRALAETIADPELGGVCDTLSLAGISLLGDADYEALAELDRDAARHGYPAIA